MVLFVTAVIIFFNVVICCYDGWQTGPKLALTDLPATTNESCTACSRDEDTDQTIFVF